MAGFIAILPIRFGDKWLQPGDPVPMERGRNYGSMVRLGQIAEVRDGAMKTDLAALKRAELDAHARAQGVEDPEKLPNKDAVIEAVEAA